MTWIDTHTHLDDPVFRDDLAEVVADGRDHDVAAFINIGYCPARWTSTTALMARFPNNACAIGLHPGHADEWGDETEEHLREAIATAGAAAVGEIGLDFYRDGPDSPRQHEVFAQQIAIAAELGLPAVIHQRSAERELIIAASAAPHLPHLVLHSFDGSARYAGFAREIGATVGVGGLAARSSSVALRDVLATIPIEQIVVETDSPYLVPPGAKGRRNTPASIPLIARRVAPLWGVTVEEFAAITTSNAKRVFWPESPIAPSADAEEPSRA